MHINEHPSCESGERFNILALSIDVHECAPSLDVLSVIYFNSCVLVVLLVDGLHYQCVGGADSGCDGGGLY